VDDFLDFWAPGVQYTKTALRPQGRLVRAAIVPLVADLLAARQLSGFGPHNHSRVLCSVCTALAEDVENTDPETFEPRNLQQHRAHAQAWLDAPTTFDREKLFERTGIRYTQLLRLEYWNPFLYTVVDTMHNLYLGLLQRHVRVIWGINVDIEDGDASGLTSTSVPPRPSEEKMAQGTSLLLNARAEQLRLAGKAVLYHLCLDRGIRRAGTVSQLVKNLVAWVRNTNDKLASLYGDELTPAIRAAEKTLHGAKASTALARKKKDVLQRMCAARTLDSNGSKELLARRLLAWVSRLGVFLSMMSIPTYILFQLDEEKLSDTLGNLVSYFDPTSDISEGVIRHNQEAIGRDTLDAYMEDRACMQLPSWVNAPPVAFGTKQHGKLSADQWRTLCIINLPLTLTRTWSFQEPRRVKMLENFLEVVEAIETYGLLEIDERQIADAERLMRRYLEGIKELYHGTKIQPNHHLALHIGVFLRLFGPVHSWRSFAFERFNFYLQSINTNMTFGELEMTFMMHSCRAANLRPLLRSPAVQRFMHEFSKSLSAADGDDRRGMRLDAILRSTTEDTSLPQARPFKSSRPAPLEDEVYAALLERLSLPGQDCVYMDERQFYVERPPGKRPLPRVAVLCSSIPISGVLYKPSTRAAGDGNIMFRHPLLGSNPQPGHIEKIILHTRQDTGGKDISESFIYVKRLKALNALDASLDPFRRYPTVGGRLYYRSFEDKTLVLRAWDIISHFASTTMDHLVVQVPGALDATKHHPCRISKPCVHVRPLDRVRQSCL
ncbi:hypothetical protein C2E23DRAFT_684025, partial [Lenzites betulinus]